MSFNWLDYALIGLVATIAAVQFLRSMRDFSRILYEAIFLVAAVVVAAVLLKPLESMTGLPAPLLFGGAGCIMSVIAIILAAIVNRRVSFGLGVFNYLFGLILAIACGYAIGHLVLKTVDMAVSPTSPEFNMLVRRSLMARDLLFFKTFIEIRAFLRFVRWKGA